MTVEGIHLKVVGNGIHGKNTRVWLGPEEVTHKVQSLELNWDARGITTATVRFLVAELEAEGVALPTWVEHNPGTGETTAAGHERRRRRS